MTLRTLMAAALMSLALGGSAQAALLTGASGAAVTDYSADGLVSFDLDLAGTGPATLEFVIGGGDLAAPFLNLNAIVRNLGGIGWQQMRFTLAGIGFDAAGSVTPTFGTLAGTDVSGATATVRFGSPEYAEFYFGNPLAVGGASDWRLNLAGLQAGERFTITASVPEPSTLAMLLATLALFSFSKRVRDKKR